MNTAFAGLVFVSVAAVISGAPRRSAAQSSEPQQTAQQAPQQTASNSEAATIDPHQLFATTCGWCHSGGGRVAGKGPQLMNTARDDDFIRNRIKMGKQGAMPAFGQSLSDADIDAVIRYIRGLRPE